MSLVHNTVTAIDQQGCEASLTQVIESGLTTAEAGEDQTICKGDDVTLSATGGVSYEWSNGSGGTAAGQTITFSPAVTTEYTVTATGSNGCVDSDDVTVFVYDIPPVSLTTPTNLLCDNAGTITLTENPAGGTFSGPGMTGNVFDPAADGVGTHTISYTYYEVVECQNTDEVEIIVDLCTGVSDLEAARNILVLPNPTAGLMMVQNKGSLTGLVDISITDLTGRLVMEVQRAELDNMNLPVDMSHLANGQYLANVIKDKSRIATIKLSKQ